MQHLKFEIKEGVGIATIDRPKALNALNEELVDELMQLVSREVPRAGLGALILTGAGEKAFVAGADIKAMSEMSAQEALNFSQKGQKLTLALEKAPFLTIAAVNGYALGGGLELALACDFIYASIPAQLGLPEVSLGLIPGFGGTQRLARAVGTRRAKELIMTGKPINAEQAAEIGLVNRVCPPGELLDQALETAYAVLKNSYAATTQAKHAINQGYNVGMTEALYLERNMFAVCFANPDSTEGMQAFMEKRKAAFAGPKEAAHV